MRTRRKPAVFVIAALAIAALAWPHLCHTDRPAASLGPLPLTPAAATAALGYPSTPDDASRFLCLTGKKLALLGDSQTFHLFNHLTQILGGCENIKVGSRCADLVYLRLTPEEMQQWWQTDPEEGRYDDAEGPGAVPGTPLPAKDEGPVAYGLQNLGHGCRDCQGCDARLNVCRDLTGAYPTAQTEVEYIAVEFTRDVSLRSANHSTTQEAITAYLADRGADYVVFNTGLHDTALKDSSPATYARNLRAYVALLRRHLPGARLLWVATGAVRPDMQPEVYREVTSNAKIHVFNAVAAAVMAAEGIPVVDPFPLLQLPYFQSMNNDGVHYFGNGEVYYDVLAWGVLRRLCMS